ncbi:MAG: glycine--tRNA ligase subunit beta [Kistimonas sp.]|nr:glycine--tRNA ligase subunit beta [Kistimonas sp.]
MATEDFLFELGTEELPPTSLRQLSDALATEILNRLAQKGLTYEEHRSFASPRRLALSITKLETWQPDNCTTRRGPALEVALDAEGRPSKAALGFARSCGVTVEELDRLQTDKGSWLVYHQRTPGQSTASLLPSIISESLEALPVERRMRWGVRRKGFVRPVRWLVMLLGEEVVPAEIMGTSSGRETWGHRFHCNSPLTLTTAGSYARQLSSHGHVMPDYEERKAEIRRQIEDLARRAQGTAVIDEKLLDEVTALTEWPVALTGRFDAAFLEMPAEALISSMQSHQKYFHLVDEQGALMPCFITVANIESLNPSGVVSGNERVIRARLADARFFYEADLKSSLEQARSRLKSVLFQKELGTVFAKTERVARLAAFIAEQAGFDAELAHRAGCLSKSDLVSEMVQEFPELQGTMGMYYARSEREHPDVCLALHEQYMPQAADKEVPGTGTGIALALADRIDTLVGLFGIKAVPSGSRDPFALRRAALGILRTIVEKRLSVDLRVVTEKAVLAWQEQGVALPAAQGLADRVVEFIWDRSRAWYQDAGVEADVFLSVRAVEPRCPFDFDQRIKAVSGFMGLPEAAALISANKRVSNMLTGSPPPCGELAVDLVEEGAEQDLLAALSGFEDLVQRESFGSDEYEQVMHRLVGLKQPVDSFFDQVLVNHADEQVRNNRHMLLNKVRALFLKVADISLLKGSR